ncbi:uncharacterized protein LOC143209852 [Lasioglossum baleicum]|uniref:uncharacterized protein LOC143209852 n=1 Tax=Lasioglossum baleicum TaxID=434251 RepID=UPI003FCE1C0A
MDHHSAIREPGLTMNLLSLLLLLAFAFGACATVPEKLTSENEAPEQVAVETQPQVNPQDEAGDKKVAKRSYGWGPWGYGGYSYGWPWYGYGHGWYPGWYPGWPLFYGHGYGGYGGYRGYGGHGGWYKGW